MKIIIPEGSGFCPGVVSAEKRLLEIRKNNQGNIYISGMFIHNKEYEKYLESKMILSAKELNSINDNSIFIISTHGIDRNLEQNLNKKFKVFDLTCPKVKNVQKLISNHPDFLTIITGKAGHPEIIGLISYSKNHILISDLNDINEEKFLIKIKNNNIMLISQTTGDSGLYLNVQKFLQNLYAEKYINQFISYNTICPSIEHREKNAVELMKKYDLKTIVIGDKLSSNSQRLFMKLKNINENTFFIENKNDLLKIVDKIKYEKSIMIVSSSSTPSFIENEIAEFLSKI